MVLQSIFLRTTLKPKFKKNGGTRDVLVVALPMLLSMSFDTLMTFVDRLFLAKLSPFEMNAALGGGGTQIVMTNLFVGVLSYATAMVAQRLGAKKNGECSQVIVQSMYFALICMPFIFLTIPLGYFLFGLQHLDPLQMEPQKLYFKILIFGSPLVLARSVLANFFTGIGETKIIMKSAFVALLVNIFANYFLIFGYGPFPKLGIAGAAYGTLLGTFSSVAMMALVYFNKKNRRRFGTSKNFGWDGSTMKELCGRGIPCGIEFFLNMFAFQSLLFLFHGMGAVSATAASIMFNWDMVAYVPLMGLEIAATSLVGRYVGAKNAAAARRSCISGLKIGWAYALTIAMLFLLLPGVLVDIFSPDTASDVFNEARPMSIFMLRVALFYIVSEVLLVIFAGALRGAGDTLWVMFTSVCMNWCVTSTLFVSAYIFHLPANYAWCAVVCGYSLWPFVFLWRWKTGRWRRHVLDK